MGMECGATQWMVVVGSIVTWPSAPLQRLQLQHLLRTATLSLLSRPGGPDHLVPAQASLQVRLSLLVHSLYMYLSPMATTPFIRMGVLGNV